MQANLNNIIQHLVNATQSFDISREINLSLLSGLSGRLLFHWYAAKSPFISIDKVQLGAQIQHLTSLAPALRNSISFGYGIAGVAWLIEVLLAERDDGYDPAFNQEIEDLLTSRISKYNQWNGEIELMFGLSGFAAFAARRLKYNKGLELYSSIVTLLKKLAVYESTDVCSWSVPAQSVYRLDKKYPDKPEYNMGLAHGVPGVICALLPAVKHPLLGQQAAKLISDGCSWLFKQQLTGLDTISMFPSFSGDHKPSRLGWCYGDLTIALTLARAGKAINRQDLLDYACDIGMHAAQRTCDTAMVYDAGLCHGSAGLMLIFQLLHQIIPMAEFEQASDYWFENTMNRYKEHALEGFNAHKSGKLVEETGLLEGYAGIGLCLLARQGISPDWADALLLA
ncbi:lanthionine synthetase LanC family protein [Alkalimonas amylolytica]|uniref:Lanthionine synthetase C-like protein n=1 Tax=Alkalimonas amylolytica TaxID=152573 RepID=A0A1H4EJY9_ALKAM|nr:lanthionine synthetase LanC family protein [Alkalimonas amylolytica]SEA85246.1 Lanthionine synthetase C-like protein [Alkalimonas amylolytica]